MPKTIPEEELVSPGHKACQGCASILALRHALKALGPKTIVVVPACCMTVIEGEFPLTSMRVPLLHTAFEAAASTAAGISAGLRLKGDNETVVMTWAGDGGTFDIGLQALSGAAEREDDLIYVCYDNEAYMNTGVQRSSATPHGAATTTTPASSYKRGRKKGIMEILVAHHVHYAATATVAYIEDLHAKFRKAKEATGTRFMHILSPCPPGWKFPSRKTIALSRLAVRSHVFPLYEVEEGRYHVRKVNKPIDISEYLRAQGRFKHLDGDEIANIRANVENDWQMLLAKEKWSEKHSFI